MKKELFERLMPLWDVVSAVEQLMCENAELKKENEHLKERVKWFEDSFEKNAKSSGEAVHTLISACLDGRITINENNETVIKSKDDE